MTDVKIIQFDSRTTQKQLVTELLSLAETSISILSTDLEPAIYDDENIIKLLSEFLMQSKNTVINILTQNSRQVIQEGHRLIEFGRKFSSRVHFKKPDKPHTDMEDSYLIIDQKAWLHKRNSAMATGEASYYDPLKARDYFKHFNEIWDHAVPDNELRRIYL